MKFKTAVFHWTFERVGGAEILASYLARALNCKVYCFGKSKLGFEDITYLLPKPLRLIKKIRSFEYLVWSSIDIEEIGDFDVIVTSGATPRAIVTPEHTMHVNYCHSTPRWLYDLWGFRRKRLSSIKKFAINLIGEALRIWDYAVDARVDYYFVNSEIIQRRLWKYLKRDSVVLYPPIECSKYRNEEPADYILFLSRLEPEKRPEESIRACIKSGFRIVVVGTGTLEKKLREKYENHPLVDIRGFVDEKEKIDLLAHCSAVIYPAVAEDFGIVPIEAFASGKPVIVDNTGFPPLLLKRTGVVKQIGDLTICNGGIITKARNPRLLELAVDFFSTFEYDPEFLMQFARHFDYSVFEMGLKLHLSRWKREFDERLEVRNNL